MQTERSKLAFEPVNDFKAYSLYSPLNFEPENTSNEYSLLKRYKTLPLLLCVFLADTDKAN